MVKHVVSLHLKLKAAAFKRNPWQIVAQVILALYGLGIGVGAFAALVALRFVEVPLRGNILTLAFAGLVVLWLLMTLLFYGMDQTLSPGRFALFPLRAKDLLPGMTITGLLGGLGGLISTLWAVGFVISWSSSFAAVLAAVVAATLGLLTCLWSSRLAVSVLSGLMERRRTRDVAGLVIFVLMMGVVLVMQLAPRLAIDAVDGPWREGLARAAEIASWTPLGWAWSLPEAVTQGQWWQAALKLALATGFAWLLWKGWGHYLDRALTSPLSSGDSGARIKASSWLDRALPDTVAGAVAARTLRYWRRDTRRIINGLSVPLLPLVLMIMPLTIGANKFMAPYMFMPLLGVWMLGMLVSTEIAYDGSALHTHVLSGMRGVEDRWGRALAILILMVPMVLALVVIATAVTGRADLLPGVLGATIAFTGSSVGAGSWIGAAFNQALPPAGSNPFSANSKGSAMGLLNFALMSIAVGVTAAPAVVLGLCNLLDPMWGWLSLGVGILTGVGCAWLGIRGGGRHLDRRWPEALAMVTYEK